MNPNPTLLSSALTRIDGTKRITLGHVLGLNGPLADTEADRRSGMLTQFCNILRVYGILAMPLT